MANKQIRTTIHVFVSVLAGTPALFGQGTFQNLDFEAAQFVLVDPFKGFDFAAALPGWSGYIGSTRQTTIIPNSVPIGPDFAYITILEPPVVAPQGRYAVSFKDGKDQLTGRPFQSRCLRRAWSHWTRNPLSSSLLVLALG